MAGQKIIEIPGEVFDPVTGRHLSGIPTRLIIENGKVETGDEWGLFRLTDDGLGWYREGAEFAAGIMTMRIKGESAVKEIARKKTEAEAVAFRKTLSRDEQERTLIRSVRPLSAAR